MASEFTTTIELDFNIPSFMDATIPLQQIAEKIVTDSKKNIRNQVNPDGTPYARLADKTIRDKMGITLSNLKGIRKKTKTGKSLTPLTALMRTGLMYNSIHAYKVKDNEITVGVKAVGNPRRDLIALIHSTEGVNKYTQVVRQFIGISEETLNYANARMRRWAAERMQKAVKKYIKLSY